MKAERIPKSASDWAMLMTKLRRIKPRPIAKLYGKRGPTPEQAVAHASLMKRWNRLYRLASKEQKRKLVLENAAFRKRQDETALVRALIQKA